jgi:hypothetical protein
MLCATAAGWHKWTFVRYTCYSCNMLRCGVIIHTVKHYGFSR